MQSQQDIIELLEDDEYVVIFEIFDNNSYVFLFSKENVVLVPVQKGRHCQIVRKQAVGKHRSEF